jgi:endonuclease/exonuclease/phosphatase (EEP) superfamily protein YafD
VATTPLSDPPPNPPEPPRRWPSKAVIIGFALYLIAVTALFVSNRFLVDRWWPATWLFYAPRWPWVLPGILLAALGRRAWVRASAVALVLFVLGPFMAFNVPWHRIAAAPAPGTRFRLLTFNVHAGGLDVKNFEQYVSKTNPDVIVLQDYGGLDDSELLNSGWKTLRLGESYLASRFPVTHIENLHLPDLPGDDDTDVPRYAGSAWCFDIRTPAGLVHVLDVHHASPHYGLTAFKSEPALGIRKLRNNATRRNNECLKLAEYLATLKGPVVLAGDFNMLSESPTYRRFYARYADAFESVGWGYGYTHYSKVSQLRLDHVLYTQDLDCAAFEIGPDCRTAHRPVIADLVARNK